jgi:hypothetical protein
VELHAEQRARLAAMSDDEPLPAYHPQAVQVPFPVMPAPSPLPFPNGGITPQQPPPQHSVGSIRDGVIFCMGRSFDSNSCSNWLRTNVSRADH